MIENVPGPDAAERASLVRETLAFFGECARRGGWPEPALDDESAHPPDASEAALVTGLLARLLAGLGPNVSASECFQRPGVAAAAVEVFQETRLAIQAEGTKALDLAILTPLLGDLRARFPGQRLRILDVGTSYGDVAAQRFTELADCDVVGIDKSVEAVRLANARHGNARFRFIAADAMSYAPEQAPHLILMMQFLQHSASAPRAAQRYWDFLSPGGCLFARNSDDGLSVCAPACAALDQLIAQTDAIPGSPDRLIGRKLYGIMRALTAVPARIDCQLSTQSVAGANQAARLRYFAQKHDFRQLYAERRFQEHPTMTSAARCVLFRHWTRLARAHFAQTPDLFSAEVQCLCVATKSD